MLLAVGHGATVYGRFGKSPYKTAVVVHAHTLADLLSDGNGWRFFIGSPFAWPVAGTRQVQRKELLEKTLFLRLVLQ